MITFMYRGYEFMRDTIVITNRKLVSGDYLTQIRKVVKTHPYAVILREKDLSETEYEKLAERVMKICDQEQVVCFLHSNDKIAEKLQCRNLHVSIDGFKRLQEKQSRFEMISVSCHSLEEVIYASRNGASQIILGTIFETECKKGMKGKGLDFVKEVCGWCRENVDIPIFAIGGITPDRIRGVKDAGARGGCMMSYAMNKI